MANTVLLTIRTAIEHASKAEKALGQCILDNVQEIPSLSVAQLSHRSGVSQATIVRFSKSLGLNGFADLKVELARATSDNVTGLYDEISPTDGINDLERKLAVRIQHTLEMTNQGLNQTILKKVVNLLAESSAISVYGLGASNLVAEDFTQKFSRIGKSVVHTQDTHLLLSNVLTQQNSQLLFLISDSGETNETVTLAKAAVEAKITVVGITSNPKSSLAKLATLTVLTSNTVPRDKIRSAATTSLISQLYTVDLLFYLFLQKNYQNNIRKLKESHLLVEKYFSRKK
ncbi:MurR/RpiR family transcriptional regulator [Companilactobacillus sp. HBUAS56257]|uniref:MurR/RpiR family transcriptional regulator n=1 Tax=Companilactobacillus sp. HBUAS56257 TaxID=3109360 RepID=UPI002FF2424E